MRVLLVDIDCLRPDHLGCYGYHRDTSPHIDEVARAGLVFSNVYASDVPCLPSRTAFFSGRFGVHTGVINHGGAQAEMFPEGKGRGFGSRLGRTSLVRCLRDLGFTTTTVSSFAERHAAYHFCAGWNEILNPGKRGLETADEVARLARAWLAANAHRDGWFLHLNFWDPHTPYRTPAAHGDPFATAPLPPWYGEAIRRAHWQGGGPHSAREVMGYDDQPPPGVAWSFPRQPLALDDAAAARRLFDGYDTGIKFADAAVGGVLEQLAEAGVLDDTAVVISADHGENLGELNVYGDHHTADQATARVPLVVRWPGVTDAPTARVHHGLHYQVDFAATMVELLGGKVPPGWDGSSFAGALRAGHDGGREALVLGQAAWTCQRAIRFRRGDAEYLCVRTYHDGHHGYPDVMLFDVAADPHEQVDLAGARPAVVHEALALLDRWLGEMMATASHPVDPMWVVLHEGGPQHTRGSLPRYLARLRATGRSAFAQRLAERHPGEAAAVPSGK